MKVMIVVTHLLGTGHLSRALTLGRAFAEQDHEVFMVSGGMPAPQLDTRGLSFLNLPPLRSDGTDFTRLLDQSGTVADPAYFAARTNALTQAVRSFGPQILITELYPFGRRRFAFELLPLIERVRAEGGRVFSSVRDLLVGCRFEQNLNQISFWRSPRKGLFHQ